MPTHAERLVWGMGDGSDLRVHQTQVGRVGGLICWESYMPLARFAVYAQGVDIWVAPTLATHELWVASMREEGMYAELDLDAARARRRLFDPVGHYNRPDVFRLVVDDRPKPHLVSLARAEAGPAASPQLGAAPARP